ncbi:Pleckstrin-like protein [Fusarium oxysporum f. sp. phaseoli]
MPLLHRLEPLTRSPELDPSCIAPCLNLPAKGQLSLTASTFNDTSSFLTFLLPSNTFSFSSSFTSPSSIIMSAVYPPGGTIVQSLKRTFADVPVDEANGNAVSTVEFLEASESLTTIFDAIGGVAFGPVKKDILGNVEVRHIIPLFIVRQHPRCIVVSSNKSDNYLQKLRARHAAAPAESATVQDLVRNELKTGKHTATEGCLWLIRGLDFTKQGLEHNVQNPSVELSDSFRDAYGNTLKPHHSFMVKPIFSAAMSAVPYRKDFYAKLGDNPEKVQADLEAYLASFSKIVAILKEFINSKEAKW